MRFFTLIAVTVLLFSSCSNDRKLPILGERETVEKIEDGQTVVDTIYQTIPDFNFVNQDSSIVSSKNFDGKIYVADFFFTSCPSICPTMHRNMLKIYNEFKGNDEVKLLSHTIDFKYDTPAKLKEYANKLGLEGNQWEFVRGPKEEVYKLAEKNYMVAVNEDNRAPGGFVHQGWFILVDKEKRLRGAYDGTDEQQVNQLIEDMHVLLDEDN